MTSKDKTHKSTQNPLKNLANFMIIFLKMWQLFLEIFWFQKKKARNLPKFLQKSWQFHNFFPKNVAICLEIFQKVPLTMLLGTFSFSKMANFCHKKKSLPPINCKFLPNRVNSWFTLQVKHRNVEDFVCQIFDWHHLQNLEPSFYLPFLCTLLYHGYQVYRNHSIVQWIIPYTYMYIHTSG